MEFGHFSKGLLSRTTYGACRQQRKAGCQDSRNDGSSTVVDNYDLFTVTRLAEIAQDAAEKPFKSVYQKFKDFVDTYGIYISLLVIFGWFLQLIVMIIMVAISIFKSGLKSAGNFCIAFVCFWPHTLHRELARSRHRQQTAGSAAELHPLRERKSGGVRAIPPRCQTCDPNRMPDPDCPNNH